jgi:nicotinamidase-related amidase
MPITTLDPRSALIVIDLQTGITSYPVIHPIDGILRNSRTLADAFAARSLPVVLVTVTGTPGGRSDQNPAGGSRTLPADSAVLHSTLGERSADLFVVKKTQGAFTNTDLNALLQSAGVTQVVVTGVATGSGVEATVRQAYELGYHVTVPLDAVTDTDTGAHEHSVTRTLPRFAETGGTADVLGLLAPLEPSHE